MNYACEITQLESKYLEWIIIKNNTLPTESDLLSFIFLIVDSTTSFLPPETWIKFDQGIIFFSFSISVISRRQIGLNSMLGVYIVLAGGIIMSFITLGVEIYWKRRVKQSVANRFRRLVVVWADCKVYRIHTVALCRVEIVYSESGKCLLVESGLLRFWELSSWNSESVGDWNRESKFH